MLGFFVFGMARSGTTVLADVLNLYPGLYCGVERFTASVNPADIVWPESFLDLEQRGTVDGIADALASPKPAAPARVHTVGEKQPRAFLCPAHLRAVDQNILIVRDHRDVIRSWRARAGSGDELRWPPQVHGAVVFAELLFFAASLSQNLGTVHVVDYHRLFGPEWQGELDSVVRSVAEQPTEPIAEQFQERFLGARTPTTPLPLTAVESELLAQFGLEELDRRLQSSTGQAERHAALSTFSANVLDQGDKLASAIDARLADAQYDAFEYLAQILSHGDGITLLDQLHHGSSTNVAFLRSLRADIDPVTASSSGYLASALEQRPNATGLLRADARLKRRLGDEPASLESLLRALELEPLEVKNHVLLAQAYQDMDQRADALKHRVLAADLSRERAERQRGVALDDPAAIQVAADLARLELRAAVVALQNDEPRRALELAERARQLQPSSPEIHFRLGQAHERLGSLDAAYSAFQVAHQLNPNNEQFVATRNRIDRRRRGEARE